MENDKINKLVSQGKAIVNGHVNEFLNKHKILSSARLAVCNACPLKKESNIVGLVCNPDLMLNPDTNEVKTYEGKNEENFIRGCGCRLKAKSSAVQNSCPINKWDIVDKELLELNLALSTYHVVDQEQLDEIGLVKYATKYKLKLKYKEDGDKTIKSV